MRISSLACGVAALFVLGCGDDDSDSGTTPSGITMSGKATFAGIGTPAGDVELCAPDLPNKHCTKTALDGTYSMSGLPANQRTVFTATKDLLVPALGVFDIGSEDVVANVGMQETKVLVSAFAPAATVDMTKGHLGILVTDAAGKGLTGWTAELTPDAGEGPLFGDDSGLKIDPALTATTASGLIGFVNMPTGKHTLKLTGTGTCKKDVYTVMTGDKTWDTEVRAGFATYHIVSCPP